MKTISRAISSAVLLGLTVGVGILANKFPMLFAFWYPRFSGWILSSIENVTSKVAFPLWEVLAALLLLWGVVTLIRAIAKGRILRWLSGLLWGVCFGVFFFTVAWGLGHFLPTKTQQIITVREYSVRELQDATVFFGKQAGDLAGQGDFSFEALAETAGTGFDALAASHSCFAPNSATVKKLLSAGAFNRFGTTGIFVPMTAEVCVNPDTYPASLPYTMCHELAHRQGANAEEDANFCAFLACVNHPDPAFRYSAYYSAFIYCYNALYAQDPETALSVFDGLSPAVQEDIRGASAHYKPYDGKIQEAAQAINDAYLKAVGQEGVKSYGLVSDALIAWYQQESFSAMTSGTFG